MSRSKKTVPVQYLVNYVNRYCLNSMDDKKDARLALGIMLENVLMDTGNYKGFNYLSKEDMERSAEGTTVGINSEYVHPDATDEDYANRFKDTDNSRVYYFYHQNLRGD